MTDNGRVARFRIRPPRTKLVHRGPKSECRQHDDHDDVCRSRCVASQEIREYCPPMWLIFDDLSTVFFTAIHCDSTPPEKNWSRCSTKMCVRWCCVKKSRPGDILAGLVRSPNLYRTTWSSPFSRPWRVGWNRYNYTRRYCMVSFWLTDWMFS